MAWMWGFLLLAFFGCQLPLNVLAGALRGLSVGVIIIYAVGCLQIGFALLLTVCSFGQYMTI
jgi:hypothetical protein